MSKGENFFEIRLWTWGRCKESNAEILYPKYVSFGQLLTLSRKDGEIDLGFAKLKFEFADSRKNINRTIYVYAKEPLIIRQWGQGSCNPNSHFDVVYLVTPAEVKQLEIKQEVREEEDEKYKKQVVLYYVEYDGKRFELSKKELGKEVKVEALKVVIEIKSDKVVVAGDTYEIRDILKSLKFRWNPIEKVWERADKDVDDLQFELDKKNIKYEVKMQ